jgi:DoxX-like family
MYRVRLVAYWIFTLIIAFEMAAGGIWDLLRIEYVRVTFTHLGYPLYLLSILAVWKIPCAAVLLIPRFHRLKEWAYAGAIFNYTGAAASHIFVGDSVSVWTGPLGYAVIALASWALRPPTRRLVPASPGADTRAAHWIVPILIFVALIVIALITLPTGPTL